MAADWQLDFNGIESTDEIGLEVISGTWTIDSKPSLVGPSSGGIAALDVGFRPARFEFAYGNQQDAGIFFRYVDNDNYCLVRVNESSSAIQVYQKVGGTSTLLDSASVTDTASMHFVRVDDDGTNITATHLNSGAVASASDSGSWSNPHLGANKIALNSGNTFSTGNYWQMLRAYKQIPDSQPVPRLGGLEYWQKCGTRYVGDLDQTYFGWVTPYGTVQVQAYNNITKQWSEVTDVVNLASTNFAEAQDVHNAPSVCVANDGTVCVFVAFHDVDDYFEVYRSARAEDISEFGSAIDLTDAVSADVYNYPQPHVLSNGDIALFYRYQTFTSGVWKRKVSTDNGATWGSATTIFDATSESFGGYIMTRQDADDADRIVFFAHVASGSAPTRRGLWFAESEDGGATWSSGGASVSLPAATADLERVFDSGNERIRLTGCAVKGGIARAVFGYREGGEHGTYTVSNKDRWSLKQLSQNDVWWDGNGSSWYTPGGDVDPLDIDRLVLSVRQQGGNFEIQIVSLGSNAAEHITVDSLEDQVKPYFIHNHSTGEGQELEFAWMSGFFTGTDGHSGQWKGCQPCKHVLNIDKDARYFQSDKSTAEIDDVELLKSGQVEHQELPQPARFVRRLERTR